MPRVVLGVSGSVAAHRALDIASDLTKRGIEVDAVMTRGAQEFLRPLAFEAITRRPVTTSVFGDGSGGAYAHLRLATEADVLVVAPASVNAISRLAHGLCDDALSTVAYSFDGPRIIAPAMNPRMWANPLTGRHLLTLTQLGWSVVPPVSGDVACGDHGIGRLAPVPDILAAIDSALSRR